MHMFFDLFLYTPGPPPAPKHSDPATCTPQPRIPTYSSNLRPPQKENSLMLRHVHSGNEIRCYVLDCRDNKGLELKDDV